jgi:hypothetical protein
MESIFKKAILRLSIRQFEPCIFVIFNPTILKFWILIENNQRIIRAVGFFDPLSRCSKVELKLGPFQIKVFSLFPSISENIYKFFYIAWNVLEVPGSGFKYSFLENREKESLTQFPSEKLDDKILKNYVRQYIDDIFGKQPFNT